MPVNTIKDTIKIWYTYSDISGYVTIHCIGSGSVRSKLHLLLCYPESETGCAFVSVEATFSPLYVAAKLETIMYCVASC